MGKRMQASAQVTSTRSFLVSQIKPKGQLVLARVPEAQRKTSGGLYLPSSAQKAATTGEGFCSRWLSRGTLVAGDPIAWPARSHWAPVPS